jgi:hypothetical protein
MRIVAPISRFVSAHNRARRCEARQMSNTVSPTALSSIELERHISVPEAAKFKGISPDTFKRHYRHLIRKVSPRRNVVKVRDLLAVEPSTAA